MRKTKTLGTVLSPIGFKEGNVRRLLAVALFMFAVGGLQAAVAQSNGNPRPGSPHDTIIIHVLKAGMSPRNCDDGGHSLFLHYEQIADPANNGGPVNIYITMTDWVDGGNPGTPYDLEGNVEPGEEGGVTTAIDCDSFPDGVVRLQIRDTEPAQGTISTQEWFARLIGKPSGNFVFTSNAQQVQCSVDPGDDGLFNTEDDIVTCTPDDWVELDSFNLADPNGDNSTSDGCVKQSSGPKRGRTPFCDITSGFLVDVDTDGDDVVDFEDQFVFTVTCLDDPATLEVDESTLCPLTSIIWAVDEDTTSMAKAQIFVGHTGWALLQRGKVKKPNPND